MGSAEVTAGAFTMGGVYSAFLREDGDAALWFC